MKKFLLLFLLFACSVHAQTAIPGLRNPTDSVGQVPTSGLNGQVYWMSIDAGNIGGTTLASGITASSLTSFGSGIALGTPASGTLTNCTFPTLNQNTTGNAGTVTNGLYSTGSYSNPSWLTSISGGIVSGNISGNAANVTGTVAIANGGTGQTSANNALNALLPSQTGASGKVLQSDGTNTSWQTAGGGSGTVTSVDVAIPGMTSSGAITTSGTVTMSGSLSPSNGGTGVSNPTAHYVLVGEGSSNVASISPTTNVGYVLTSNGTGSDPSFQAVGGGAFPVPVQVDSGGTGDTTLTSEGILYGNGTSAVGVTAAGNAGGFLAGSGANLTNPIFTDSLFNNNLATTYTMGFGLFDTTHASAGTTVMQSPSIILGGNAWCTTATATDSVRNWRITNVPSSQSSGNLSAGTLRFDFGNSNIGYTNAMSISGSGIMNVPSGGSYAVNGNIVLNSTTLGSAVTISSLTSLGALTGLIVNKANITTTYTENPVFENATASVTGTHVQQSPSTEWLSHVWSQTATAHDTTRAFDVTCVPISSTNPILADLIFRAGNGGTNMQPVLTLVSTGDLELNTGHLTSASTIGSATDDGTGITSASASGSDVAGVVTLTAALNAGGGSATIAFGTGYATAPVVTLTPSSSGAGLNCSGATMWVSSSTTNFVIHFNSTAAATGFTVNYHAFGPTP